MRIRSVEDIINTIRAVKSCRKIYRRKKGNVEVLAYLAAVPEWTITIFNH